jgi:CheY-like chemotaxis protein
VRKSFFFDIAKPEMDGYEVAKRIRESASHDMVQVALTGYGPGRRRPKGI